MPLPCATQWKMQGCNVPENDTWQNLVNEYTKEICKEGK